MKGKILVIFILVVIILGIAGFFRSAYPKPIFARVELGGTAIRAQVADTYQTRISGLSDRKSLSPDEGMVFVFDRPAHQSIWMKGMYFPLDIFWINGNKIVHIEENVPVPPPGQRNTPSQIYKPEVDVDYVLETNAGFAAGHNIRIGDSVSIELPPPR